jgi:hypothetical protein
MVNVLSQDRFVGLRSLIDNSVDCVDILRNTLPYGSAERSAQFTQWEASMLSVGCTVASTSLERRKQNVPFWSFPTISYVHSKFDAEGRWPLLHVLLTPGRLPRESYDLREKTALGAVNQSSNM